MELLYAFPPYMERQAAQEAPQPVAQPGSRALQWQQRRQRRWWWAAVQRRGGPAQGPPEIIDCWCVGGAGKCKIRRKFECVRRADHVHPSSDRKQNLEANQTEKEENHKCMLFIDRERRARCSWAVGRPASSAKARRLLRQRATTAPPRRHQTSIHKGPPRLLLFFDHQQQDPALSTWARACPPLPHAPPL